MIHLVTRANCPHCHGTGFTLRFSDGEPTADRSAYRFTATGGLCKCATVCVARRITPEPTP